MESAPPETARVDPAPSVPSSFTCGWSQPVTVTLPRTLPMSTRPSAVIGQVEASGWEDAPELHRVRHLQDDSQQSAERQEVYQDVGAEAEERIPVARDPEFGLESE